jgi:hypothetical protein
MTHCIFTSGCYRRTQFKYSRKEGDKMSIRMTCPYCKKELPLSYFLPINDIMFPNGKTNICTECLKSIVKHSENPFQTVDRICQWLGIPFIPDKWIEAQEGFEDSAIEIYVKMYREGKMDYINWGEAFKYYKELEQNNLLKDNIIPLSAGELNQLRHKWGQEYSDEEELKYLEHLYQDIVNSYSIFGGNQIDQIKKICKVSLVIDQKIRSGEDYSKDFKCYNDLCKLANLEAKNIKDATDFSSVGEIFAYLEKNKKWLNQFYNNVEKDIVDKTMHDMQNWSKNFYINESAIPGEVESRLAALQLAEDMEDELNRIEDDGLDNDDFIEEDFEATAGIE